MFKITENLKTIANFNELLLEFFDISFLRTIPLPAEAINYPNFNE